MSTSMAPSGNPATSSSPGTGTPAGAAAATDKDLEGLRARIGLIEADDRKAADAIDQIILIGGPAAILASLTFMKDFAPAPIADSMIYLFIAWALLLLGAVNSVVAQLTTRQAARRLRRLLEGKLEARTTVIAPAEYDGARSWNTATRWMNWSGLALFMLGIVALLQFARLNLEKQTGDIQQAGAQRSAAIGDSLLAQCERAKCALFIGYDYDFPSPTRVAPQPKEKSR